MPRKDGTRSKVQPTSGEKGMGQSGSRRQRSDSAPGPGGYCVCPSCGAKTAHQRGTPCYGQQCPKCGTAMNRE